MVSIKISCIYINTYTHSHAHTHNYISLSIYIYIFIHTHNSYTEYTLMHIHLTLSYWTFFQHQTTGSRVRKTSTSDLFLECLMPLSMFRCVYHFSDTVSTPVRLFMSISISLGVQLWQICGKWQNHRSSTNCLRCSLTAWHLAEIVCSFKMQLVVGRSRNDFFSR